MNLKLKLSKKPMMAMIFGLTIASIGTQAYAADYKVQANDTLLRISQAQNVPLQTILAVNPGVDPSNLQLGQTIHLGNQENSYTVTGDETFWTISQKLHISLTALLNANPDINPQNLYQGLKLRVPSSAFSAVNTVSTAAAVSAAVTIPTAATVDGKPLSYSKEISCVATGYSGAPEENGGWGGLDYYGNALKVGTIAVDPSIIPLGSTVYITGYSFPGLPANGMIAHATDVGGAIKGNRVDIFVPGTRQQVDNFGFQNVKIYILK